MRRTALQSGPARQCEPLFADEGHCFSWNQDWWAEVLSEAPRLVSPQWPKSSAPRRCEPLFADERDCSGKRSLSAVQGEILRGVIAVNFRDWIQKVFAMTKSFFFWNLASSTLKRFVYTDKGHCLNVMRGAVFPKFSHFGANGFFHRKGVRTDEGNCFIEFGLLEEKLWGSFLVSGRWFALPKGCCFTEVWPFGPKGTGSRSALTWVTAFTKSRPKFWDLSSPERARKIQQSWGN